MKPKTEVEIHRCPWVDLGKPDYVEYHDRPGCSTTTLSAVSGKKR